eukprot:172651-Amphidinium_carterae.1
MVYGIGSDDDPNIIVYGDYITSCTMKKSSRNKRQLSQRRYNNHKNHHHKKLQNVSLFTYPTEIGAKSALKAKVDNSTTKRRIQTT